MRLDFDVPDRERFPCLGLAYGALAGGGSLPAVLNAANEEAVSAFLDGRVPFTAIPDTIREVMDARPRRARRGPRRRARRRRLGAPAPAAKPSNAARACRSARIDPVNEWNILTNTAAFIVVLGLIIFFHEFGHFITAKAFGMRVFIFSFGFGKRLLGFKWGDTDCRVSLIPLGGYVKLEGEPDDHPQRGHEPRRATAATSPPARAGSASWSTWRARS